MADGVVVGSALVRFLEESPEGDLGAQVRWLKSAMLRRRRRRARPRAGRARSTRWRQRIDVIDAQLMRLLNSRSACAVEIGKDQARARPARLLAGARGLDPGAGDAGEPGAARPDGACGACSSGSSTRAGGWSGWPRTRAGKPEGSRSSHGHRDGAFRRPKSRSRRSSRPWWRWATTSTAPPASTTPCWARWACPGGRSTRRPLELIPGVREVVKISEPYKLVGRTFKADDTVVDVAGVLVGGPEVIAMAGPCSVETPRAGGRSWRGRWRPRARACCAGAPSSRAPRPTPSRATARRRCAGCARPPTRTGLAVVSEVMDLRTIEMMLRYVDCLQVGARNMQNFDLLKELGKVRKPVLLKRGPVRHHRGVAALRRVHPGRRATAR